MDGWLGGRGGGWMEGGKWLGGRVGGWMDGGRWMVRWVGLVGGWVDGWVDISNIGFIFTYSSQQPSTFEHHQLGGGRMLPEISHHKISTHILLIKMRKISYQIIRH